MEFKKYQHIERLGTPATDGILDGTVYVFPKLDGCNVSVYLNDAGEVEVASRNRVLKIVDDHHGVLQYVLSQPKFKAYLNKHPNHRLFGEWLIPQNIHDYRDDAWRKLYIFDVMDGERYLTYDEYFADLLNAEINIIECIVRLENPTLEQIQIYVDRCTFLMKGLQPGEGIVLKRYDFVNRFGCVTWAKIVRPRSNQPKLPRTHITNAVEVKIIEKFLTAELVEKEYCKLLDGQQWDSKLIPKFLGIVWHAFITEETFNFLCKFHNPKIDFGLLNRLAVAKIKNVKSELFN